MLIETILKQLGVEVTTVEDGEEAVKEACSGEYQLVLMDVQMPGMDGLDATRAIRKQERKGGKHLGIVALTALAMPGDREKCLQAGMDDYLPKPVEKDELVELLLKFLTSRALVVESDPDNQNILVRTLIESGWRVTIAETRRSAMYEASLSHFDLILFDMSMPQMESVEAVKILRQLEQHSGQQAVIIGVGDTKEDPELQKHGIDGYIQRPITKEKMLQKLKSFT